MDQNESNNGNGENPKDTIKIIHVLSRNRKRVMATVSKNGSKAKTLSLEETSKNLWKDQYGHSYEIDRALLLI